MRLETTMPCLQATVLPLSCLSQKVHTVPCSVIPHSLSSIFFLYFKIELWMIFSLFPLFVPLQLGLYPPRFHRCSVQFSLSVVSNSSWPHGPQHARPPCPLPHTCQIDAAIMENTMGKTKDRTAICSSNTTAGYISGENKTNFVWKDMCTPIFIAVLFIVVKIWKTQTMRPLTA